MLFGSFLLSAFNTITIKLLSYVYTPSTTNVAVNSAPTSPTGLCVSPDNTSIYVTSSNDLYTYTRDTTTGYLTALAPISVLAAFGAIVSSDGLYLYVYKLNGNSLQVYNRTPSTGALVYLSAATPAGSSVNIKGLTLSPDGTSLYASDVNNYTVVIFVRNPTTGILTSQSTISVTAPAEYGIVVSPDNNFVYVVGTTVIYQFSRNLSTGALTALSPASVSASSGSSNVYQILMSSDGNFVYTLSNNHISMFSRNLSTGLLTALSPATFANLSAVAALGICLSSDGKNIYQVTGSNQVWELTRDVSTGLISSQVVASFIASQAGTVLTVTSVLTGTITLGAVIGNSTYATTNNWVISSFGTGTGGTGTYNMSASNTIASTTWYVYNISNLTNNTTIGVSNCYCIATTADGSSLYTVDGAGNVFEFSRK